MTRIEKTLIAASLLPWAAAAVELVMIRWLAFSVWAWPTVPVHPRFPAVMWVLYSAELGLALCWIIVFPIATVAVVRRTRNVTIVVGAWVIALIPVAFDVWRFAASGGT